MKRIRKQIAIVLSLCLLVCACTACGPAQEQVFTESDFSITLNSRFEKENGPNVKYAYTDGNAGIAVDCMSKEEIKESGLQITSLNRFAILVIKSYGAADNALVRDGLNHSYCEFDSVVAGKNVSYYSAFYETDTHYWMVVFACDPADYTEYQPNFANWASTVTVQ